MKIKRSNITKPLLASKLAVLAVILAGPVALEQVAKVDIGFFPSAFAADDGDGGPSGSGKGPNPERGGGHGGTGGSGDPSGVPKGQGQGGPGADSDAKGPNYTGGEGSQKPGGEQGGRPVWAQEGIPEIELGRLNVVRSPSHVIDRSVAEAITNFDEATMAAFLNMTAADAAALLIASYDTVIRIDSPLENIGLYRDLILTGTTGLAGVTGATQLDLAAILMGSASDKTLEVTTETVEAINTILGITMSEADVDTVAAGAELVRDAIATGHGI